MSPLLVIIYSCYITTSLPTRRMQDIVWGEPEHTVSVCSHSASHLSYPGLSISLSFVDSAALHSLIIRYRFIASLLLTWQLLDQSMPPSLSLQLIPNSQPVSQQRLSPFELLFLRLFFLPCFQLFQWHSRLYYSLSIRNFVLAQPESTKWVNAAFRITSPRQEAVSLSLLNLI